MCYNAPEFIVLARRVAKYPHSLLYIHLKIRMTRAEGEAFDAVLLALFPLAGVVGDAAVILDHELDFEVGGVELLPVLFCGYFGADADVVLFGDVDVP